MCELAASCEALWKHIAKAAGDLADFVLHSKKDPMCYVLTGNHPNCPFPNRVLFVRQTESVSGHKLSEMTIVSPAAHGWRHRIFNRGN